MYATMTPAGATMPGGAAEEIELRQLAGPRHVVLRLHDGEPAGPDDFAVEDDRPLGSAASRAAVASVVTFSGPLSQAMKDAGDRADRDRIGPAMASRPGGVRVLRLWQPDRRRQLVVVLAVDQATLEGSFRTISSMQLLPGEDPALLPGPDHVEIFEVLS